MWTNLTYQGHQIWLLKKATNFAVWPDCLSDGFLSKKCSWNAHNLRIGSILTVFSLLCIVRFREGRAALVTSFGVFKFMACYSLTQFISVCLFYWVSLWQIRMACFSLTQFISVCLFYWVCSWHATVWLRLYLCACFYSLCFIYCENDISIMKISAFCSLSEIELVQLRFQTSDFI